ncbi:hypothetical protein ACHWQZ_G019605 [Mnemiopsis leidyi]
MKVFACFLVIFFITERAESYQTEDEELEEEVLRQYKSCNADKMHARWSCYCLRLELSRSCLNTIDLNMFTNLTLHHRHYCRAHNRECRRTEHWQPVECCKSVLCYKELYGC